MDGTTWTDPRYTELVEAWDVLKGERVRRSQVAPCGACGHGLGAVVMVDLETKKPLITACAQCRP